MEECGDGKVAVSLGEDAAWVIALRWFVDSKKASCSFMTFVGGFSDLCQKMLRHKS